ncbi:helix-turn-helix transcriptional regulator [Microbacterium indicum]|uniref:helix-turn-helix transcriptional regulator n=1 Tax=Microbacterium indicum TaxID=358100 RepID=UPI00055E8CFD|nr:helix-turn-helix transcriptional regulator [Microbacterium indicum]
MAMDERLSRPRLVSLWERVMPGSTVLVTAQHRSGVATSVREWLAGSGRELVEWSSNRTKVPASAPDADVVVLDLEGMREPHGQAVVNARERWPDATLIAVSSTRWPPQLPGRGFRPERVFAGSLFGFTPDEALDRAAQLGLDLAWDDAAQLLERIGTHAGFVDAVLRAAAARGSLDEQAIRAGSQEATEAFSSDAAAGVFRPNAWAAVLASARIGPMPRRTLLAVWDLDEVVRAALDNILQSGFFVEDIETETIQLRPDIRGAVIRRIEAEAQAGAVDAVVAELASRLLRTGAVEDGWNVVADLPGARRRLLTEHWWQLGELDVARVAPWLEEATRAAADPSLRIAAARTLIDVTSAGHSGRITAADRRAAARLLDQATAGDDVCPSIALMAEVLRGVILRLEGRYAEAHDLHDRLANENGGRADDGPERTAVLANLLVHAGLSAFDATHPRLAADRLTAAAAIAHAGGHAQLAGYAHEILMIASTTVAPSIGAYQSFVDSLIGARVESRPLRSVVEIWNALYVVDPAAVQAALDDAEAAAFADPLALRLVSIAMRTVAHGLLETPDVAARSLEIFQASVADHELSPLHTALLTWARVEGWIQTGESARAVAALEELRGDAPAAGPLDVLLARALLASSDHAGAVAALERFHDDRGTGIISVWAHALLFHAHAALGSDGPARDHLALAIVSASRARPVLPFVIEGRAALAATIAQAEHLGLDAAGRRFVDELARVRDDLQGATRVDMTLSERERAVAARLADAESTRHLAQLLHVSPNTVKTQLRSIYRKLGVSSWADAVAATRRLGLTE